MNRAGHVVQRDALADAAGHVVFSSFGALGVIGICTAAFMFANDAVLPISRFQHVSHQLDRGHIRPKRFERFCFSICFRRFQPRDKFAMPPEDPVVARAGHKRKGVLRTLVNRGVEFAHDVF